MKKTKRALPFELLLTVIKDSGKVQKRLDYDLQKVDLRFGLNSDEGELKIDYR